MGLKRYPFNAPVRLFVEWQDPVTQAWLDPTTVDLYVKKPDDTVAHYSWDGTPPDTISRVAQGRFEAVVYGSIAGDWAWRWEADGDVVDVREGKFSISEQMVVTA